ncbi:Geranylgeranyl reductase [Pseudodesulfovibrio profundus]|uniref:Geranylgeranyl reductase n=1 Tax=Pseudodesulfovibrio profundus TaxID=57320 RepID=A0A2C8F9V6_9BACT|nr:NAD(P)/FAD-dependent oxidoreductase [Pseudodesulfovibrio profundus]SOB58662.1 Geranylgeranyl reductase [Pseudodesulfovibrio profundus]
MLSEHDVIIVGCGPAGTAAAVTLARRGLDVVMVDRACFPRKKLCGGLLTWKAVKLLEVAFQESATSLTEQGIINYASDLYAIKSFDTVLAEGELPYPFHFVDRSAFDAHLLKLAEQAGAKSILGTAVTACDPEAGEVVLSNGDTLRGKHVIGADGANSTLRASHPRHDRKRFREGMAPAIEVALPKDAFPREVSFPELYVGFLDAGYGWVFPNKDRVIVGICGLRRNKENFSVLFEDYLAKLGVDRSLVGTLHGHPLPYGNYISDPVHKRLMLAGDAGGFVEPLFGEGIFFALCTGLFAGESILEAEAKRISPGPLYSRRLHREIVPELKASDRLRWALFLSMRYTGTAALGCFVRTGASPLAEMVHGMRSYSLLRRKEWDFLPQPSG